MNSHAWQNELPATTRYQGILIPVYLDDFSLSKLKPEHYEKANWLVHIGKHVNTEKQGSQRKALTDLRKKLKESRLSYLMLADCDKARVDEFHGLSYFDDMIAKLDQALDAPLAEKRKYENLYFTFATSFNESERKKITSRSGSNFQDFMAVVVRLVTDDFESEFDKIVERVTKQYKRVVLNQ